MFGRLSGGVSPSPFGASGPSPASKGEPRDRGLPGSRIPAPPGAEVSKSQPAPRRNKSQPAPLAAFGKSGGLLALCCDGEGNLVERGNGRCPRWPSGLGGLRYRQPPAPPGELLLAAALSRLPNLPLLVSQRNVCFFVCVSVFILLV